MRYLMFAALVLGGLGFAATAFAQGPAAGQGGVLPTAGTNAHWQKAGVRLILTAEEKKENGTAAEPGATGKENGTMQKEEEKKNGEK